MARAVPLYFSVVLAVVLLGTGVAKVSAQDQAVRVPLSRTVQAVSEGVAFVIPLDGILAFRTNGGELDTSLDLNAALADVQAHATELLRAHLGSDDPCGDRLAIDRASVTPDPPTALVTADIRYGRGLCVGDGDDRFETDLIPESAGTVVMRILPGFDSEHLIIRYELESASADGDLGRLLAVPQVHDLLKKALQRDKRIPISELLPPDLRHIKPRLTDIRFGADDGDVLTLHAEAEASLTGADLARILELVGQ